VATILIIEDELNIAAALQRCIESAGHTCQTATTGNSGLQAFHQIQPDLIILDLKLPDIHGLEVCTKIRHAKCAKVPYILMLTVQTEEVDRIIGYSTGADDYMPKPFSPQELIVRIRALLRRDQWREELTPAQMIATPHLQINLDRRTVETRSSPTSQWLKASLSPLEFEVLVEMARHPGRVWSREQLLRLWESGGYEDPRVVDSCIKRLRKKLTGDYARYQGATPPQLIQTKLGLGYAFEDIA
jgi:DNA-binding response OmpR family regulator